MGDWLVSADLLARTRFVVSPLHETVAAMLTLDRPYDAAGRAFRAAHGESYAAMLAAHPARAALAERMWRPRTASRPGWMADFLGAVSSRPDLDLDAQLSELAAAWPDRRIRAALRAVRDDDLSPTLRRPGLGEELIGLLEWVWTVTLAADWPRRERVLRADVVSRTSRLAQHGWAEVLPGLGGKRGWRAGGRLTVNGYDLPDRDIRRAEVLWFIPVHTVGGWVCWEEPDRYAVVYPVSGTALDPAGMPVGEADADSGAALGRLLGANRAVILRRLGAPLSTTHLVGVTGLPAGSVSSHLRVLLDNGLIERRRSGREVLYWRSALGETLAGTSATPDHAMGRGEPPRLTPAWRTASSGHRRGR